MPYEHIHPCCFIIFQSKLKRIPSYLAIQFVRFYYKEKEAINAKILKVSLDITINISWTTTHVCMNVKSQIIHCLISVSENIDLCSKLLCLKKSIVILVILMLFKCINIYTVLEF